MTVNYHIKIFLQIPKYLISKIDIVLVITYWIQISYVYFFVNRNFVKSMFNENQGLFLVLKNQTLLHSLLAMRVEQNFKEIVNNLPIKFKW